MDEFAVMGVGLSPLARGTHTGGGNVGGARRFIPAGAGNTRTKSARNVPSAVYPRWRGEHGHDQAGIARQGGLSPLARGTQVVLWRER